MRNILVLATVAVLTAFGIQSARAEGGRPRLLDLGATSCIPCKMMAPLLDEMKKDYAGVLDVEFIDVWKNPAAGKKYGIRQIPTQIFFDAKGKERFRHVGFFGKEEILAKWKDLGYDLKSMAAAKSNDKTKQTPAQVSQACNACGCASQ